MLGCSGATLPINNNNNFSCFKAIKKQKCSGF